MKSIDILKNGIFRENPIFRLVLGMCPTLAVTTSAKNGLGMGVATMFVLLGSNIVISLLRKIIPDKVRIPAYITVIAGFVTIVQLLMKAYAPALDKSLGLFIPLIVVNCIILARAESFASKYSVGLSVFDAIGMGIGFTLSLFMIGTLREALGAGTFFGIPFLGEIKPLFIMILPPGGFLILGLLMGIINKITNNTNPIISCHSCPVNCSMKNNKKEAAS